MKKFTRAVMATSFFALAMAGCGGGGGGGGVATQAVTTVYLYGQMSSASNSKIDSVQTTINVPAGVQVNYSTPAPAGYPNGTYPMRHGFATPSGTVLVSADDLSGTYNTATRKLLLNIQNNHSPKLALQCYTSARGGATVKGSEVAKLTFRLDPPGGTPSFPVQDTFATIYQYREPPNISVGVLGGSRVNFDTRLQ